MTPETDADPISAPERRRRRYAASLRWSVAAGVGALALLLGIALVRGDGEHAAGLLVGFAAVTVPVVVFVRWRRPDAPDERAEALNVQGLAIGLQLAFLGALGWAAVALATGAEAGTASYAMLGLALCAGAGVGVARLRG